MTLDQLGVRANELMQTRKELDALPEELKKKEGHAELVKSVESNQKFIWNQIEAIHANRFRNAHASKWIHDIEKLQKALYEKIEDYGPVTDEKLVAGRYNAWKKLEEMKDSFRRL